ncbi:MAG TPA: hypothetical protein PLM75_08115 [bacterium]|nr:hypothetical protein [bacterium]
MEGVVNEKQNTKEEIIFKIKFRAVKLVAYSFIFFSIRRDSKLVGFKQVLASLLPNFFEEFIIDQRWNTLKEKIFNFSLTKKEMINQPLTEDMMEAITQALEDTTFRENIFDYADSEKYGMVVETIKSKLSEFIPGRLEVQCEIEKNIIEDEIIQEKTKKEEDKEKELLESPVDKFINVEPIVDELLGKQIKKLKKNDLIPLIPADPNYTEKFYKKLPNYKFGRLYGSFVEFYKDSDKEYAVFNITKNVFCRFEVKPELKEKKIKYIMSKEESGIDRLKFITDNTFLFYLIIVGGALVLCILSWFYYNWYFSVY